jgi:lipoprotein-anchoring transpeptidase ErfK/SrfK
VDKLKTAIVVVLLLAVLYGVYVTLNQPDQDVSDDIAWASKTAEEPLQIDFDQDGGALSSPVTASVGDSAPWSSDAVAGAGHEETVNGAYDPAPYVAAPNAAGMDVAAPDLIASMPDGTSGSAESSGLANSAATYDPYGVAEPGQSFEPLGSPAGNTPDNAFRSNPTTATGVTPSTTGSMDPAFARSESYGDAPGEAYGRSSGFSDYPPVKATAAPSVADSYKNAATSQNSISPMEDSRLQSVVQTARGHVQDGQYYEALLALSLAYDSPGISEEERLQLRTWLDPLAGKVIYSKEHLVGAPYQVQANETLQTVAAKYQVTWQLLANINGLLDPAVIEPGMSIKVVPGPFRAEIDVAKNSLTLFTGRLYAGTFAITVNGSNPPAPGDYKVTDKQPGHTYYAGNAQTLSPQDPNNPFGGIWIDLGGNVSIHGSSSTPGQSERLGCIGLNTKDANDLYGILSLGSNVVIRR